MLCRRLATILPAFLQASDSHILRYSGMRAGSRPSAFEITFTKQAGRLTTQLRTIMIVRRIGNVVARR